jgi:ABC-2 type transport system permease protein
MPIFDQGYQHWQGEFGGHAARWCAITLQGLRVGFKNRYLRTVLYLAWMPAFALVTMLCVWGMVERQSDYIKFLLSTLEKMLGQKIIDAPREYRVEVWTISFHFFLLIEMYYAMLLILMVGPNLISQDLRFNALPLYFSRPLSRLDYFIGKLGVITALLGMIVIVPSIVAYIAGLLFSADISIIGDTYRLLLASVAYGIIISLSGGMLILALSSLSRNSRYVAAFWIALILVGSVVYSVLAEAHRHEVREEQQSMSFATSEDEVIWQLEVAKSNWRPLVSYTGNISRIGQELLGVDKCWRRISESWRARERRKFLALVSGPQYPWYWSAIVLASLFALSAWILKRQVKSLDRLK